MNSFGLSSIQHTDIQQRCQEVLGQHGATVYLDLFTHKNPPSWFSHRKNMQLFFHVLSSQMKIGIPLYEALQQFAATLQSIDPVGALEMERLCKEIERGSWDVFTLNTIIIRIAEYSKALAQRLHFMSNMGSFTASFEKLSNELQRNPQVWENG